MELVNQTKQEVYQVLLRLIQLNLISALGQQTLQSRQPLKMDQLQLRLMQVARFSKTTSLVWLQTLLLAVQAWITASQFSDTEHKQVTLLKPQSIIT